MLRAGGATATKLFHSIVTQSWLQKRVPLAWRAGGLAPSSRGGGPFICGQFRGLLIFDHMRQAFADLLDDHIDPCYEKYIPSEQRGAATGRGTDLANHMSRSALDAGKLTAHAIFIVFIGLIKAFDFTVRQVVFGWKTLTDSTLCEQLEQVGLDVQTATNLVGHIDENACLLDLAGVASHAKT